MDGEPLLFQRPDHIAGAVNYLGLPASRSSTGRWRSAAFVMGAEIAERFTYFGVSVNLISYLTGPLRQSTASAAASINAWTGVAYMLPLLGAFMADSYLGSYLTILLSSILYILALGMLTVSTLLPSLLPPDCRDVTAAAAPATCEPSPFQVAFFYISLYLLAIAQGGHKSSSQAFGVDQFDKNDPQESKSRSSFFNWWNFGFSCGILLATTVLTYVQDNISWSLGFGIPLIALILGLLVFLFGTRTYRFYGNKVENPFARIAETLRPSAEETKEEMHIDNGENPLEAKRLLQLFPIWLSCLMYFVVYAQPPTFFTKQAVTLDRRIIWSIQVPPAALHSLVALTILVLIPLYNNILVPIARRYSKLPSGITMLQRIGTGLLLSMVAMVTATLVETRRLQAARDSGLVDQPEAVMPMSWWWLAPQFVLIGASMVFTLVGLQEFFYDQVPDAVRSIGLAFSLSLIGVGEFLSSLLVSAIDKATSKRGESWLADDLNHGHLDYFYCLLAGLSALSFSFYIYFARAYRYKGKNMK